MKDMVEVTYNGRRYRAYANGAVRVWYDIFGESGWDRLTNTEMDTARAVRGLARQTEEGGAWDAISDRMLFNALAKPRASHYKPIRYNRRRGYFYR